LKGKKKREKQRGKKRNSKGVGINDAGGEKGANMAKRKKKTYGDSPQKRKIKSTNQENSKGRKTSFPNRRRKKKRGSKKTTTNG